MLSIHILNVGHGDSIVLEHRLPNQEPAFAVIDSNAKAGEEPRALKKLKELGAQSLSFVAITHPHADHYLGFSEILAAYKGKIQKCYTFPIEKSNVKKLAENAKKYATSIDPRSSIPKALAEFIKILVAAKNEIPEWVAEASITHRIIAPGFTNVEFHQILPPARVKGKFFEDINEGNVSFVEANLNNLSMAFLLKYKGFEFVLGGDGTQENWRYQHNRWKAIEFSLNSKMAKLPHHGSATDSSAKVLDVLFEGKKNDEENIACISADGRTHPDNTVLDDIIKRGIKPYCTNLAKRCGAAHQDRINAPDCDPVLARFLNMILIGAPNQKVQPCQGDITIRVLDDGSFKVETEHKHPCPFRGDFDRLFGEMGVQ